MDTPVVAVRGEAYRKARRAAIVDESARAREYAEVLDAGMVLD